MHGLRHNTGLLEVAVFTLCVILKCCICQQYPDDDCFLDNGNSGICIHLDKCPEAIEEIRQRRHPKLCSFMGKDPIVCCRLNGSLTPEIREDVSVFTESSTGTFGTTSTNEAPSGFDKERCIESNSSGKAVVGGERALNQEFPHMAALGFGNKDNIQYQCGGSLISETYVITAAHCLYHPSLGEVRYVRLGDLDLFNDTDDADPQDFLVTSRIPYPDYKPPVRYHDIALIRLDRPAKFTDYVKMICLQTKLDVTLGLPTATGWGRVQFGGERSSHLLKVYLQYFTNEECRKTYSALSTRVLPNGIADETQVCVGNKFQPKDTCQGDSGGPLQILLPPLDWVLVGITSFGKGCGTPKIPGVYTRVSYYVPWIKSIVWGS